MGSVSIDLEKGMRKLESRYVLYKPTGVRRVLREYYYLTARMEREGDFDACIILQDLETAIKQADLSPKQAAVLDWFKQGYTWQEIGDRFGVEKTTVQSSLEQSTKKIAAVYKKWAYVNTLLGEGDA